MTEHTDLHDIELDEVSLVEAGANKGAHVMLFKRAGKSREAGVRKEGAMGFDQVIDRNEASEDICVLTSKLHTMLNALHESVYSILEDSEVTDKKTMVRTTFKEFSDAVEQELSDVAKRAAERGDDTMPKDKDVEKLTNEIKALKAKIEEQGDAEGKLTKKLEEVEKRAAAAEKIVAKAKAWLEKAKAAGYDVDIEDNSIDKSKLPEEVRKRLDAQEAKINGQAETIKKIEDAALTRTINARLDKIDKLPIDREKMLPMLKGMKDEDRELMFKQFEAQNEAVKKGDLFKNLGGGGNDEATAIEKVAALAADIRKADPKITEAQARVQVWQTNPELRKEYDAERRRAS